MNVLNRIKLKISRGEIEFTDHLLLDKLPIYEFTTKDITNCVFSCEKVLTLTNDIRGTRYVIIGYAVDGTPIEVICRFYNKKLYFITIYDYDY